MRTLLALAIAVGVHGALSVAAHATDQLVPGKIFIRRPAKLAKFIAKPISPATFALPAPANSPIAKPWELSFKVDFTWYHIPSNAFAWKGLETRPARRATSTRATAPWRTHARRSSSSRRSSRRPVEEPTCLLRHTMRARS